MTDSNCPKKKFLMILKKRKRRKKIVIMIITAEIVLVNTFPILFKLKQEILKANQVKKVKRNLIYRKIEVKLKF